MKQGKEKKITLFMAIRIILPKLFKCTPLLFLINCFISILHGTFWGVETMFMQRFFDEATAFASKKTTLQAIILALLLLGCVSITTQILNGIGNFLPNVMLTKCNGKFSYEMHQKIARLSPIYFEHTEQLDLINKAEQGKNNCTWFSYTFLTIATFYIPYFLFMGWYLFSLKPSLVWCIIIVFIPTALTQILRIKVFSKIEDESAPIRRQYDYYETCMVGREYFKETRLLGGFFYFKRLYLDSLKCLNKLSMKAHIKSNLVEFAMKLLTVAGYMCILYMLFIALMNHEISVGAFAAIFSSIGQLYNIMEEIICRHIGNMAQNLGTIQNYIKFLQLSIEERTEVALPEHYDIQLEHVTFSYPNAEKVALNDVNFNIKDGETVAIVGENGSGKSTLIRLITGLYKPTEGSVKHNDVPTNELLFSSLSKNISAVFQKYCRYQMTLSDNITISQTQRKVLENELDHVCERSGFSKNEEAFPNGYETMLSREFDGVDLSGGQWQRIAIARAFFRRHNLIILDEPTAAIDPFEETKIYNRFAKLSQNKTAIIVTHRLGSVKLADQIIVMRDGTVAEIGTHTQLMEADGEYKRMYLAQSQWYQETNS